VCLNSEEGDAVFCCLFDSFGKRRKRESTRTEKEKPLTCRHYWKTQHDNTTTRRQHCLQREKTEEEEETRRRRRRSKRERIKDLDPNMGIVFPQKDSPIDYYRKNGGCHYGWSGWCHTGFFIRHLMSSWH